MASNNKHFVVKYLECRHNYAARSNGHVLDGCGEFCPTGAPETPESFICAACYCHRNFHRKIEVEVEAGEELPDLTVDHSSHGTPLVIMDDSPPSLLQRYSAKPRQLCHPHQRFNKKAMPSQGAEMEMDGGDIEVDDLKRKYSTTCSYSSSVRIRLDPYQKARVWAFAEEVMGWRWTKHNEQVIPFCTEIGITPKFLKNWINNNSRRIGPLRKNTKENKSVFILS